MASQRRYASPGAELDAVDLRLQALNDLGLLALRATVSALMRKTAERTQTIPGAHLSSIFELLHPDCGWGSTTEGAYGTAWRCNVEVSRSCGA